MTTLTPAEPVPPRTRPARLLIAAMAGGVLAALVNTTLLVTGNAFGVAFLAPIGGPGAPLETIQATNVVIMSLVPALGAGLLLALLRGVTRRPPQSSWRSPVRCCWPPSSPTGFCRWIVSQRACS